MKRIHFLPILVCALMSAAFTVHAQTTTQTPTPTSTPTSTEIQENQSQTDTVTDTGAQADSQNSDAAQTDEEAVTGGANGGIDNATDADAEEATDGTARFIPTEQVSQDLGVSFPVDI